MSGNDEYVVETDARAANHRLKEPFGADAAAPRDEADAIASGSPV
jgi:hypothetical protein